MGLSIQEDMDNYIEEHESFFRQVKAAHHLSNIKPKEYRVSHDGGRVILYRYTWIYVDVKDWVDVMTFDLFTKQIKGNLR